MSYRIDLFAVFIFLGIVQAVFLCLFFLTGDNRKVKANVFQGLMLLSIALCIVEIFLMYTGYIINCLYLVDFSEPISLLIGPFFYLMVVSIVHGNVKPAHYWHLAFPVFYLALLIPFLIAPEDVKYNAWIGSYQPGLPFREYDYDGPSRANWFTQNPTELTLLSLTVYAALALFKIIRVFSHRKESFWSPVNPVLGKLRAGMLQVASVTLMIILIKIFNENDTGDHWIAAYVAVIIYVTSFSVISQSGFFKQHSLAETQKYKGSAVTPEVHQITLQKLRTIMEQEKPFLNSDFSLPDLAQRLGTSVHTLSQVINEGLGKNFFEMTAGYRVQEAKRLLVEQRNIKVEEIADQVGYSSKSSFNTAFKKITGKTPSEFRAS
jgi:AraC-like DNA-binding protein